MLLLRYPVICNLEIYDGNKDIKAIPEVVVMGRLTVGFSRLHTLLTEHEATQ